MNREARYRDATVEANQKRAAFLSSMQAARQRLTPARLKQDVKDKVTGAMLDATAHAAAKVQQRPIASAAAAGAFLLFLARRPLGALFGRIYVGLKNRRENSETEDG